MTQGEVETWRYEELPMYGKQLIWDWFQRGERGLNNTQGESFEPFIYTWFALNAWAACVTDEDIDRLWQSHLADDSDLSERFDRLRQSDEAFRESLNHFVTFWPIFEVKSIRRLYPEYREFRTIENRAALRDELIRRKVPCKPEGWNPGDAVMWPHLLQTLARVRNNLFHGDKGPDDPVDQEIVYAALRALVHFLRGAQLFIPTPSKRKE